jgi:sulfatase maturation enzyme AslB (radical SAM superfamily)
MEGLGGKAGVNLMLEVVYFYHEDNGTSRARYGEVFLPASINSLWKYLQCDYHITIIKTGKLPKQIDTSNITLIEDKGLGSVAAQAKAFLELEYEHWLHLDDDVILHRPIGIDTFLTKDGKPIIRCRKTLYDYVKNGTNNSWKLSVVNTDKIIQTALRKNFIEYKGQIQSYHSPHFYTRELCRLMRVLIGNELKYTAATAGRKPDMICDMSLPSLFAAAGDCVINNESIYEYIKSDADKTAQQIRDMKNPFVLINDAPVISSGVREFLDDFKSAGKRATIPPVKPVAIPMGGSIQQSVVFHCNLNCPHCSHQAKFAHGEVSVADVIKQQSPFARKVSVASFNITGGEPLLHSDICGILSAERRLWGDNPVYLYSNGLLLFNQKPKFWEAMRRNNIVLRISIHNYLGMGIKHDFTNQVMRGLQRALNECLTVGIRNDVHTVCFNSADNPVPVRCDPAAAHKVCQAKKCSYPITVDGLYHCHPPMVAREVSRNPAQTPLSPLWLEAVKDYKPLAAADITANSLAAFCELRKTPGPLCGICPADRRRICGPNPRVAVTGWIDNIKEILLKDNIWIVNNTVNEAPQEKNTAAPKGKTADTILLQRMQICGFCKNKINNICQKHNKRIGEIVWQKERCEIW